jgi:serpin B
VALAAVIVAGACASAVATPTATGEATSTPWPTSSAWPTDTTSPTPSLIVTPSPSSNGGPTTFDIVMGKAPLLAPAEDYGVLAGTEINDFGFDLLRRLDTTGNLCASPASIALALAMVRPGARGQTAAEMDGVLHNFGSTGQEREIVALLKAFEAANLYDDSEWYASHPDASPDASPDHTGLVPIAELDVSNAVFSQKGMSLEQAYLDALSSGFGAGIGQLDYASDPEAARLVINKWASDRTKGRIPEILQPGDVDELTRIELANAIYLKAAWDYPFDPKKTKPLPFTTANGKKVSVPTMATRLLLSYSHGSGYRAVSLPLSTLSMTLVVPDDMKAFVKSLSAAKLKAIDKASVESEVTLTLPRFSAESRVELAQILGAMGMPTAFSGKADLSGITTEQRLFLDKVVHQANIDVVEEGTTASAVTVVGGKGSAGAPPPSVTFSINKPFLYFIREWTTGAVLFMGRIDDPSAKN